MCPSCKINIMRKDDSSTWESEHIIKVRYGGPDFIYNLIPICKKCNQNNRPYETTYDYMVALGTMDEETAKMKKAQHSKYMQNLREHIQALICIAYTDDNIPCKNNRVGEYCCMVHEKNAGFHLRKCIKRLDREWREKWGKLRKIFAALDAEYDELPYNESVPECANTTCNDSEPYSYRW